MSTQQLKNGGIIVNETNLSAATRYYPTDPNDGGRDVRRLAECVYRIAASGGVTITFEASMEDRGRDGIDAASVVWYDITDTVVQASDMTDGHASFADSTDVYRVNVSRWAKLRIVAVTSDTSNALRVTELGIPLGGSMSTEALATQATLAALLAAIAPGTWTPAVQVAPADSRVISAAPCTVRTVVVTNKSTAVQPMMLFDSATVPANGTFPRLPVILVPASTTVEIPLGALVCSAGLSWSSTTTYDSKTIAATTALTVSAELV